MGSEHTDPEFGIVSNEFENLPYAPILSAIGPDIPHGTRALIFLTYSAGMGTNDDGNDLKPRIDKLESKAECVTKEGPLLKRSIKTEIEIESK
jgi:hypothetical protein